MKISEIRDVIDRLNWNRNDLGGATRDEFKRMNVAERLGRHIANVEALVIAPRFADDRLDATEAVARARTVIARWRALQDAPAAPAIIGRSTASTLVNYSGRA